MPEDGLTLSVNNQMELNTLLKEYQKWNKRQASEIVNAKLYFITLNAMIFTIIANKGRISTLLRRGSRKWPAVPLAAILVNKQLHAKGKKGLTGEKMKVAEEKLIKRSVSRVGAARASWIGAAKTLDYYNKNGDISFVKRHAPKQPKGLRQYGRSKSSAIYAPQGRVNAYGKISDFFGRGKQASKTIHGVLQEGLNKAIKAEVSSTVEYINRKYSERHEKMNRGIKT